MADRPENRPKKPARKLAPKPPQNANETCLTRGLWLHSSAATALEKSAEKCHWVLAVGIQASEWPVVDLSLKR